jgi:hypothetical protein
MPLVMWDKNWEKVKNAHVFNHSLAADPGRRRLWIGDRRELSTMKCLSVNKCQQINRCHFVSSVLQALLPNKTTPTMPRAHQSELVEHGSLPLTDPTLLLSPLLSVSRSLTFTNPYTEMTLYGAF